MLHACPCNRRAAAGPRLHSSFSVVPRPMNVYQSSSSGGIME